MNEIDADEERSKSKKKMCSYTRPHIRKPHGLYICKKVSIITY